jgi:uncharacterized alpha-E superfamily protein
MRIKREPGDCAAEVRTLSSTCLTLRGEQAAGRHCKMKDPHLRFGQVRDGSQAFQGVAQATLTHDEPYEFIRLGTHLERAEERCGCWKPSILK